MPNTHALCKQDVKCTAIGDNITRAQACTWSDACNNNKHKPFVQAAGMQNWCTRKILLCIHRNQHAVGVHFRCTCTCTCNRVKQYCIYQCRECMSLFRVHSEKRIESQARFYLLHDLVTCTADKTSKTGRPHNRVQGSYDLSALLT